MLPGAPTSGTSYEATSDDECRLSPTVTTRRPEPPTPRARWHKRAVSLVQTDTSLAVPITRPAPQKAALPNRLPRSTFWPRKSPPAKRAGAFSGMLPLEGTEATSGRLYEKASLMVLCCSPAVTLMRRVLWSPWAVLCGGASRETWDVASRCVSEGWLREFSLYAEYGGAN